MLKPRVEAGTNLLCPALVKAELHPLTVWRRKSLFMLVHQGFQTSVRALPLSESSFCTQSSLAGAWYLPPFLPLQEKSGKYARSLL